MAVTNAISNVVLASTAALAGAAALRRALSTSPRRDVWRVFALAGLVAAASHLTWAIGGSSALASSLLIASFLLFTAGTAGVLNTRDRAGAIEVGLDTVLVLGAATVMVLRWTPAAQEAMHTQVGVSAAGLGIVVGPIAAIASLFFALIALSEVATPSTLGIAAAALSFAVATLPFALRGVECCRAGNPLSVVAAAGWLFVAFAALRGGAGARLTEPAESWRMREAIGPAVALLIGIVVVDVALRPPLYGTTALALGVLGVVLALQLAHLHYASRSHGVARRELAQSRRLIDISNTLTGATDLNETQNVVVELVQRILNCRSTALLMVIDGGHSIELKAAHGFPASVIGMRFPVEGSFTADVIADGKPQAFADPAAEPYLVPEDWQQGEARFAVAPLLCRGDTIGTISCVGHRAFSAADLELLGALADQAALAIENALLFEQVNALSLTDPLTGLANRRQLERDLGREFAAGRRGRRLVVVMFDMNGFKEYNDRFGHVAGDQALRVLGEVLATSTRASNLAARYGGDEFVALLADSDSFGAQIFIDRVKEHFGNAVLGLGHGSLSISAGMAEYLPEMVNPAQLLAAADRALYENKASRVRT